MNMLLGGTLCDVLLGNRVERRGMIMVVTHKHTCTLTHVILCTYSLTHGTYAHSHIHTHTHTHTHTLPHLGAAKWKINVDKPPSE